MKLKDLSSSLFIPEPRADGVTCLLIIFMHSIDMAAGHGKCFVYVCTFSVCVYIDMRRFASTKIFQIFIFFQSYNNLFFPGAIINLYVFYDISVRWKFSQKFPFNSFG